MKPIILSTDYSTDGPFFHFILDAVPQLGTPVNNPSGETIAFVTAVEIYKEYKDKNYWKIRAEAPPI